MIDPRLDPLGALHSILIRLRFDALQSKQENAARVLDVAEYLVQLIAKPDDQTLEFRQNLEGLAQWDPNFTHALERFDQPKRWC